MSDQCDRTRGLTPFRPGQSGNPGGRPKTKPITEAVLVELDKPARGKSGQTKRQKLAERLTGIALHGNRSDSLAAIKLLMSYTDGLPLQQVELDVVDVARKMAEERGLDPGRVIGLYEHLRRQRGG